MIIDKYAFTGTMPSNRKEKEELKNMIRDSHNWDNGDLEENFLEAIHYVNTCIGTTKIPIQVQSILNDDKCVNLTNEVVSVFMVAFDFVLSFYNCRAIPFG